MISSARILCDADHSENVARRSIPSPCSSCTKLYPVQVKFVILPLFGVHMSTETLSDRILITDLCWVNYDLGKENQTTFMIHWNFPAVCFWFVTNDKTNRPYSTFYYSNPKSYMFRLHETCSVLDCCWYNEVFVWTVCLIVTYCFNNTGMIHIMMALVCLQHFRSPEISNKSTNKTIFKSSILRRRQWNSSPVCRWLMPQKWKGTIFTFS